MIPTDWLAAPFDRPRARPRRPLPEHTFEPHARAVYPVPDLLATSTYQPQADRPRRRLWGDRTPPVPPPLWLPAAPIAWLSALDQPRQIFRRRIMEGEPITMLQPIIAQQLTWLTPLVEMLPVRRLLPVDQTWAVDPSLISTSCVDLGLDTLSAATLIDAALAVPALIDPAFGSPALIDEEFC